MAIPTKPGYGTFLAVVVLVVSCIHACGPLHVGESGDSTAELTVQRTGMLAHTDLVEASGAVFSRREADLLWVVNDGGHPAALYAIKTDGGDQGRITVAGARNTDWEDLAGFDLNGRAYLLIADVGDNQALRKTSRIYVVEEPDRLVSGAFPDAVEVAWQFDFRFEDGPRDCEGVAVEPQAGRIFLITKRTRPPQLYVLPLRPPAEMTVPTARRVGEVSRIPSPTVQERMAHPRLGAFFSQPTAMDIRADNRLAVVLTYKDAYLFRRARAQTWAEALAGQPVTLRLPELKQKEAACFDGTGRSVYVTTEQRPAPLFKVALPSGI